MTTMRPTHLKHLSALVVATCVALAAHAADTPAKAASGPDAKALAKLCADCAIVSSVRTETRKGKASGLGAVGGAVAGGVLGHQVGGGTGKTVATGAGAVAGGLLGNELEKRFKKHTVWITTVTMKDGSQRSFEAGGDPGVKAGEVVQVEGSTLKRPAAAK